MFLLVACTARWTVSWDMAGRWAAVVLSGNCWPWFVVPPPRTFWPRRRTFHCFWSSCPQRLPARKETFRVRKTCPWPKNSNAAVYQQHVTRPRCRFSNYCGGVEGILKRPIITQGSRRWCIRTNKIKIFKKNFTSVFVDWWTMWRTFFRDT